MNKEAKGMFDKLLKFAEDSQYKIFEVCFVTKTAWVFEEAIEAEIRVKYVNGEWLAL